MRKDGKVNAVMKEKTESYPTTPYTRLKMR